MSNSGDRETESDVLDEVYGRRQDLLDSLRFFEGRATVSSLKDESGCPDGSVHHHLGKLAELGLVERDGEEVVRTGKTSDVYRLTSRGERVISEVSGSETTIEDVEDLSEQMERHGKAIENHGATIEELEQSHKEIEETLDLLKKHLGVDD